MEELRCLAAQLFVCDPVALRQRALRPQLKCDPLDSESPTSSLRFAGLILLISIGIAPGLEAQGSVPEPPVILEGIGTPRPLLI